MLQHALRGIVIFLSFHFILPDLNYCLAGKPKLARVAIRAVGSRREKINDAAKKEKLVCVI